MTKILEFAESEDQMVIDIVTILAQLDRSTRSSSLLPFILIFIAGLSDFKERISLQDPLLDILLISNDLHDPKKNKPETLSTFY